jgi:hypothetical protein
MKQEHSIALMCAALAVSRAGYYQWKRSVPSPRATEDARLLTTISEIHATHRRCYGSVRVQEELKNRGLRHSRKRVARLMKSAGLAGRRRRRYVPKTTQSNHKEPIAPNHLASYPAPSAPDLVWVSDITYVRTREGWLYVAAILDLWSRKIVGWATGKSLEASLVIRALDQALGRRNPAPKLLYHSDRGIQYACKDFRAVLQSANLVPSMSRKGNCYDNAAMESFWSSYKNECVYADQEYPTRSDAIAATFDYIEVFYNRIRLHSSLGYKSPVDFENLNN